MRTARIARIALAAPSALIAVLSLPAQEARPPAAHVSAPGSAIRIGKDGFVLPAGDIEIRDLIDASARFLQRNILYRQEELAQAHPPLSFQKELALDAIGCEEVLCQLLYVRGLALLTLDADRGLYEVVSMQGPRAREVMLNVQRRTPEEVLRRPNLKQPVLTAVQLQHINANIATNALRPFFAHASGQMGGGISFGTAGGNRSLLICGFQDQVASAVRLLQSCDVPGNIDPNEFEMRLQRLEAAVAQIATPRPKDAPAKDPAKDPPKDPKDE
jgi:hypothetical protein